MSQWYQVDFPYPSSAMGCLLHTYHDTVLVIVVLVFFGVGWFLTLFLFNSLGLKGSLNHTVTENKKMDIFWMVAPFVFLCGIGYISFFNLYEMEVGDNVNYEVSMIGDQWYWEYHYIFDLNSYFSISGEVYSLFVKEFCKEKSLALEKYGDMTVGPPSEMMSSLMPSYSGSFSSAYYYYFLMNTMEVHGGYSNMALMHAYKTMDAKSGYYMVQKTVEVVLEDFRLISNSLMEMVFSSIFEKWLASNCSVETKIFSSVSSVAGPWEMGLWELFLKGEWVLRYNSYTVPEEGLNMGKSNIYNYGGFRNQELGESRYLYCEVKNEILVSTSDVLHSWGVSELGVKVDAILGRVKVISVEPALPVIFYSVYHELCGSGHSEIPTCVVVTLYESLVSMMKLMVGNSEELKDLLNSSVMHLCNKETGDWGGWININKDGSLMFVKLFTFEFSDVNVFNMMTMGVKIPSLVAEVVELGFSCVKNQNFLFVKTINDFLLLSGNFLDDLWGDSLMFKVLDFMFHDFYDMVIGPLMKNIKLVKCLNCTVECLNESTPWSSSSGESESDSSWSEGSCSGSSYSVDSTINSEASDEDSCYSNSGSKVSSSYSSSSTSVTETKMSSSNTSQNSSKEFLSLGGCKISEKDCVKTTGCFCFLVDFFIKMFWS
nr:cytochrome c oxidase subunit II [Ruditapes philippinarum]